MYTNIDLIRYLWNMAAMTAPYLKESSYLDEESVSGSEDETESGREGETTGEKLDPMYNCESCQAEFPGLSELLDHKKDCVSLRTPMTNSSRSGDEGLENENDAEDHEALDDPEQETENPQENDDEEVDSINEEGKRREEVRRQRQDAENNNSVEEGETEGEENELPLGFPFPLPGHVTLEALQNTKVAVAQFAATAMANNTDNAAALQELAVLQSTLYTLQTQQMMQLSLIQQLQRQLQITRPKDGPSPPPTQLPAGIPICVPKPPLPPPAAPPRPSRTPTPVKHEVPSTPPTSQSLPATRPQSTTPPAPHKPAASSSPISIPTPSLPPCSISSSFASSIITNYDPPPSPSEPNTLEMLQRRAQEVLDNASQGLLANNLADELAFRKNGKGGSISPYDSKTGGRNEPFFKHRCRYCGKVFGSDSALQIHIRSHTGERPFKCNVCGSRFTTKGNLKVHFQRHTSKFPHIKMNPNPVPEHLDKYHPPLLAQIGQHPPGVPSHHPVPPHPSFPSSPPFPHSGLPLYRPPPSSPHDLILPPHHPALRPQENLMKPLLPLPLFGPRPVEQEMPENLSKPVSSIQSSPPPPSEHSDRCKRESCDEDPQDLSESSEPANNDLNCRSISRLDMENDSDHEPERYTSPSPYDNWSIDSKHSDEDAMRDVNSPGMDSLQDQPENLSNKTSSHQPVSPSAAELEALDLTPRPPAGIFAGFNLQPPSKSSPAAMPPGLPASFSPVGFSTVRGNTTCNICYKTFACNSALEIHYRSHTKERPFKCTVCDRGFSTKGNMKQHMLTHKIRDVGAPNNHGHYDPKTPLSTTSSLHDETSNASTESMNTSRSEREHPVSVEPPTPAPPAPLKMEPTPPPPPPPPPPQQPLAAIKRSPPEDPAGAPHPKRQPSIPKHLCHVCNKNFSSSSALQIHMRTHTGDKPFRCTVCQKAFTTKGNLKVHMGTHMWTNGASRRGRRMSLDLPPLPKDSPEFLQRRPDLFYPYLPAPFLNGMQQKLNEISVIQNVGSNVTNGLLGFGAYGGLHSGMKTPPSPLSEKPAHSPLQHLGTPPGLWDLHFNRKSPNENSEDQMDCPPSPPPPGHVPPPPRGEGLAA
ncbi:sal-like protein 3 isoform X2 [Bemisia tabaci]|uniref:sal-like protein 3 isoform X2 n=1 Tax=Bemisia tabaci TaxID=7038 RepID=UPI003B27CC7B